MLDLFRHSLNHHDGIVHHDTDHQDNRKQGQQVDGKPHRRHRGERPDDRDRHCCRWHQRRAPVLQKDHDHQQHQDASLIERFVDLINRGCHKHRRVKRDFPFDLLGKGLGDFLHFLSDVLRHLDRVGARQLIDRDATCRLAVKLEKLVVVLAAKLDAGDILQPGDFPLVICLEQNLLKVFRLVERAGHVQCQLKILTGRYRWRTNLSRGKQHVLTVDRIHDILRCQ